MFFFIRNLNNFLGSLTEPTLRKFIKYIFMITFVCVFFGIVLSLTSIGWFYFNLNVLKCLERLATMLHTFI